MKRIISTLLAITICFCIYANDELIKINGIKYYLNDSTRTAMATCGECINPDIRYSGNIVIPESVSYNGKDYKVNAIDNYTFYRCTLSSITLPDCLERIGAAAFNQCKISEIKIPKSVNIIGTEAFSEIDLKNKTVYLYGDIDYIGSNAMASFNNVVLYSTKPVNDFENDSFYRYGRVHIKKGLKKYYDNIYSSVFEDADDPDLAETPSHRFGTCIWEIKSDSTMYVEGNDDFWFEVKQGRTKGDGFLFKNYVKKIIFGDSVKSISEYAFRNSLNLEEVYFGKGTKEINSYAFSNCAKLKKVEMPDSLDLISDGGFASCKSLKEIILPEGMRFMWESTFKNCTSLEYVKIPGTINKIYNYDFYGCTSLKNVELGEGISTIYAYAFCKCDSLTEMKLPSTIEVFGDAISGTGIKKLIFPASINCIGGLPQEEAYIYATTLPKSSSAISGSNCIVYVPKGYLNLYKGSSKNYNSKTYEWETNYFYNLNVVEFDTTNIDTPVLDNYLYSNRSFSIDGIQKNNFKYGDIYIKNGKKYMYNK